MKNVTQILLWIFLFSFGSILAQQEKGIIGIDNWLNNWTEFKPSQKDYGEATKILTGDISENTTLYKRDVYLLLGNVFVTNNATLTIEPGTVILGDNKTKASLTITRGAKIMANGQETDPIVFSSNKTVKRAGDWGGLIILGEAPTNKFGNGSAATFYSQLKPLAYEKTNFGGFNANSDSGILKYVRIEYAGNRTKNAGYHNGLLLASVGNETILENVMVSYSAGNSFEVWGGEVTLNKAVSYKSNGNDYSFNFGSQAVIDNSLAIRSSFISSSNGSRCLQTLSYNKKEEVDFSQKGTNVIAKNLTFLNDSKDLSTDISMGLVHEAVFVGENTSLDMNKSVISGFNPAVVLEDKIQLNQENLEKIKFTSMYFNNCNGNIFLENNSNNDDLEDWYGNNAFFNVYSKGSNKETFIEVANLKRPDFRLRINKIVASND